jgi:hypothetical protein
MQPLTNSAKLVEHARLLLTVIASISLASPLEAQRSDTLVRNVRIPTGTVAGTLVPELTIGGPDATADEYLFESINSLLVARDGRIWVLDGRFPGGKPSVRRYDPAGKFLSNVGRRGDGPGEWQFPSNLEQLRDGRFILRDAQVGKPLTFYKSNGDFDTTWAYKTSTIFQMRVDTSDAIWLQIAAGMSLRSTSPSAMIRVATNGKIIDTVRQPARLPVNPAASFSANNGRVTSMFTVPYQPRGVIAWSPHGYLARGTGSRYAIDLLLPRTLPNGRTRPWRDGDRVVSIRSNSAEVPVTDAERADQIAYLNALVEEFGATRPARTPDVPKVKPALRSISFDLDGRIWARISQPSERYEPEPLETPKGRTPRPVIKWREPSVFDVFEPGGVYLGRIATPYELQLMGRSGGEMIQARGDVVWGVVRDEDGVEAIRRYRIAWRRSP